MFANSDSSTLANPVSDVLGQFKDASGVGPVFVGGSPHAVTSCTLRTSPPSSLAPTPSASREDLQVAAAVRDTYAAELLRIGGVRAVGIGTSYDHEGSPAILVFATKPISHRNVPAVLEDIPTRIVEGYFKATDTPVSLSMSTQLEKSVSGWGSETALSATEYDRAKKAQSAHLDELMSLSGVQGVGIGRSFDSSEEAALTVFAIRGSAKASVPLVIDGVRVRFVESSRFRAGNRNRASTKSCSVSRRRLR